MMEEKSWRDLLGEIISDVQERQRIADALRMNPVTLMRWTTGKSNPRQDNLRPLLDALPQYRLRLIQLISKEFPTFLLPDTEEQESLQEIPSAFYAQVMDAYASNPIQLRAGTVGALILRQMLQHLDPHQIGLVIIIAKCTPPPPCRKTIRSLRHAHGRGTPPWQNVHDYHTRFYGAESQMGQAIMTGHPSILQSREERQQMFPIHGSIYDQSAAAYPILLGERVAGSLGIVSSQANYFTLTHLDLIEQYVDLLTLAFESNEFYNLQEVTLGILPSYKQQFPILTNFHQRVARHMIEALQQQRQLTRPEAEVIVWQEIEEELLHQSYHSALS